MAETLNPGWPIPPEGFSEQGDSHPAAFHDDDASRVRDFLRAGAVRAVEPPDWQAAGIVEPAGEDGPYACDASPAQDGAFAVQDDAPGQDQPDADVSPQEPLGRVDLSEDELDKLISNAYQSGYASGALSEADYEQELKDDCKKQTRRKDILLGILICLAVLLLFSLSTCAPYRLSSFWPFSSSQSYVTEGDTIGIITIDGTIQYDGTACSPEGLKELLDEAEDDDNIKAVVLRVNSGGGTATAGEEMAEYVKRFSKPVVVSSASINASAAYEISSQADYIFVAKTTEIGAIGTAMQVTDLSGLMEKLGINVENITSAESKDSSYGTRALTDEERAEYQRMVTQINDTFIANVAAGRGMDEAAVRALATGMVYTGIDAVDNGLADAYGTREDALDYAAELAGLDDYETEELELYSYDLEGLTSLLMSDETTIRDLVEALNADGYNASGAQNIATIR